MSPDHITSERAIRAIRTGFFDDLESTPRSTPPLHPGGVFAEIAHELPVDLMWEQGRERVTFTKKGFSLELRPNREEFEGAPSEIQALFYACGIQVPSLLIIGSGQNIEDEHVGFTIQPSTTVKGAKRVNIATHASHTYITRPLYIALFPTEHDGVSRSISPFTIFRDTFLPPFAYWVAGLIRTRTLGEPPRVQ